MTPKCSLSPTQSGARGFSAYLKSWLEFAYTIFLFTRSDIKTIIAPSVVFGLCHGVTILVIYSGKDQSCLTASAMVWRRAPILVLYIWINLLPFNIDNQRRPEAVKEDILNKPWRAIPSGRMTSTCATRMMRLFYVAASFVSVSLGAPLQCLALMLLGHWYNSLGGSEHWLIRNLINCLGYICFLSGATQVALFELEGMNPLAPLNWWFATIAGIIFTTVHIQDLSDQEGDRVRGRDTLPIKLGGPVARWLAAGFVAIWSFICPWQWKLRFAGLLLPLPLGILVSWRTITLRSVVADKFTFVLWNAWLVTIFTLPLYKALQLEGKGSDGI